MPVPDPGIYVPVNLDLLLHRIVVAPWSPRWFLELVKSVSSRLGFPDTLVEPSDLDRSPLAYHDLVHVS